MDKPNTEITNDDGLGPDFRYVTAAMQGWRVEMEDAHHVKVAITDTEPFKHWSFFAVFDGHAGSHVATHSAKNLLSYLLDTDEFKELVNELSKTNGAVNERAQELITKGIKTGFLKFDARMAFEKIKAPNGEERGGTTAICAILTPEYIFFGNLGDSRGLLGRKNEQIFFTQDHKPYMDHERERIVKAGGTVLVQRVNGCLAVSRALGDFQYKEVSGLCPTQQQVSPEPDVYIVKRNKEDDEFIVLACDGIYDVIENEELCLLLRSRFTVNDDIRCATNQVLNYCFSKGSRDNMTIIVVVLDAAPKANPEATAAEAKWLQRVREKTLEIVENHSDDIVGAITYSSTVIQKMKDESNLNESPLFGGLDLARHAVDEVIDQHRKAHNIPNPNASMPSSPIQEISAENSA